MHLWPSCTSASAQMLCFLLYATPNFSIFSQCFTAPWKTHPMAHPGAGEASGPVQQGKVSENCVRFLLYLLLRFFGSLFLRLNIPKDGSSRDRRRPGPVLMSPTLADGRRPIQLRWAGAGQIGPQGRSGAAVGHGGWPEVRRHLGRERCDALWPWLNC